MKSNIKVLMMILITGLCVYSCYQVPRYERARLSNLNLALTVNDELQVMTPGGIEYRLKLTDMDSLAITGAGWQRQRGHIEWQSFSGVLPLDSLDLVLVYRKDNTASTAIIIVGSALLYYAGTMATSVDRGISAHITHPEPGNGWGDSCPFIYSWNGAYYVFEAEAFGTALGKALEYQSFSLLPGLKPDDGRVRIKIGNQLHETHYINAVTLDAIELGAAVTSCLDAAGLPWPLSNPNPPVKAEEFNRGSILTELQAIDQRLWRSSGGTDYYDEIELAFLRPAEADSGSLVITGINTQFTRVIFRNVGDFLGDQMLAFTQAAERDPELVRLVQEWIDRSSLKISLWDGTAWAPAGKIAPQANAVFFTQLARLKPSVATSDTLRVRLTALADFWNLTPFKWIGRMRALCRFEHLPSNQRWITGPNRKRQLCNPSMTNT